MTDTSNGQVSVRQVPGWAQILQQPFPVDEIGIRPQIWCTKCSKSDQKYCGETTFGVEHVRVKCKDCGQRVTRAHDHLHYVGHADATKRLLEADPLWTWEPMERDVDPDLLKAAIAGGDLAIINAVIAAAPPKLIELQVETSRGTRIERVMWIWLILHDEDGGVIRTPGVGDATGKPWTPNALKELIGDAIRNAAMRRGLALDLWRKIDLDQARKETALAVPDSASSLAAALFDQAGEENQDPGAKNTRGRAAKPAPADNGGPAGINPEAQAAADLAYQIATAGGEDAIGKLFAQHELAVKKKLLQLHCADPSDPAVQTQVVKVFARARATLEPKQQAKA